MIFWSKNCFALNYFYNKKCLTWNIQPNFLTFYMFHVKRTVLNFTTFLKLWIIFTVFVDLFAINPLKIIKNTLIGTLILYILCNKRVKMP